MRSLASLLAVKVAGDADVSQQYVEQAGAICYRRTKKGIEVLLIGSLRNGRWGIPKGGIEDGETSWQAAAREAFEESGARGECQSTKIGVFHYAKATKPLPCRVHVHLMPIRSMEKDFPEQGRRALKWSTTKQATELAWNPELQGILRKVPLVLADTTSVSGVDISWKSPN